jgi:hypothetical protein
VRGIAAIAWIVVLLNYKYTFPVIIRLVNDEFKGILEGVADCDTDHYLVAAKLRERLSVSKRVAETFDMQRFDLRKLNDAEVKEQYQVKITNRFAALENTDENVDMDRGWENIRENINISAKESLGHYELH